MANFNSPFLSGYKLCSVHVIITYIINNFSIIQKHYK